MAERDSIKEGKKKWQSSFTWMLVANLIYILLFFLLMKTLSK